MDLSNLANTGLAGIALASLILLGLFIRMFFKFMSNHVSHNTKATQEHTDVIRENTGVLRELKEWLMNHNGKSK